ncbi:hypothetical protein ACEQ8H_006656 [Pleosporales sp. CAS-2024a]
MKTFTSLTTLLVAAISVSAQYNDTTPSPLAPTSTINITPGCPSGAPANLIVTRSNVAVPSCAAGNGTQPMVVSMSGSSMTPTSSMPANFTGAASSVDMSGGAMMLVLGGAVAVFL